MLNPFSESAEIIITTWMKSRSSYLASPPAVTRSRERLQDNKSGDHGSGLEATARLPWPVAVTLVQGFRAKISEVH
jgi:hypothetical protein